MRRRLQGHARLQLEPRRSLRVRHGIWCAARRAGGDAANAAAKDISVQIKARKEAVKNVRKIERTIENCLSKIEDCKEELNESLISVEKHRAKLWYV